MRVMLSFKPKNVFIALSLTILIGKDALLIARELYTTQAKRIINFVNIYIKNRYDK